MLLYVLEWWRQIGLACDDHERGAGRTDVISRATALSVRGHQARPLVEDFTDAPDAMTMRRPPGVRRFDRVEGSSFASKCLASMVCGSGRSRFLYQYKHTRFMSLLRMTLRSPVVRRVTAVGNCSQQSAR